MLSYEATEQEATEEGFTTRVLFQFPELIFPLRNLQDHNKKLFDILVNGLTFKILRLVTGAGTLDKHLDKHAQNVEEIRGKRLLQWRLPDYLNRSAAGSAARSASDASEVATTLAARAPRTRNVAYDRAGRGTSVRSSSSSSSSRTSIQEGEWENVEGSAVTCK